MDIVRCAIYIRVSTEEQANKEISSLDAQEDLLVNYVNSHKYELVKIYREEGVSGTNIKNRLELQKLLLDARARKFDLVITTDLDRISRNLRDFMNIWQIFKENGIKFVAINQKIDTTTITGEALVQQLMVFAELESKMNKQRAEQKRKFEVTKKGKWYGGTLPLGFTYDKKKKLLIQDKKEADIVKLIFDLYIKEKSFGNVSKKLNDTGYRTKSGNLFSRESIRTILRNPLYIGKVKYKGEAYKGNHQGIIDDKKFNQVQAIIKENQKVRGRIERDNHQYILKGLIRCEYCKNIMTPKSAKSGKYFYYSCTKNERFGKNYCEYRRVSAPVIENIVVYGLKELRKKQDLIDKMINKAKETTEKLIIPMEKEKTKKKQRLEEVTARINNLIEALMTGKKNIRMVEDKLEELEREKELLEKEIKILEIRIDENKNYRNDGKVLKEYLEDFNFLYDKLKPIDRQRLLQVMVREVEFNPRQIQVKIWDLPQAGINLQKTLSFDWFAKSQTMLQADNNILI